MFNLTLLRQNYFNAMMLSWRRLLSTSTSKKLRLWKFSLVVNRVSNISTSNILFYLFMLYSNTQKISINGDPYSSTQDHGNTGKSVLKIKQSGKQHDKQCRKSQVELWFIVKLTLLRTNYFLLPLEGKYFL